MCTLPVACGGCFSPFAPLVSQRGVSPLVLSGREDSRVSSCFPLLFVDLNLKSTRLNSRAVDVTVVTMQHASTERTSLEGDAKAVKDTTEREERRAFTLSRSFAACAFLTVKQTAVVL